MTLDIRHGGTADLALVEPLWHAMLAHHAELTGAEHTIRSSAESWELSRARYREDVDGGSAALLLGYDGADLVGYAMLRWKPATRVPTWDFGPVLGEIESIAVLPGSRGTGVGTALIEACRAELRSRGIEQWCVEVVVDNPAAQLYRRSGFADLTTKMFGRV